MEIIWKDLQGYEGIYMISNSGLLKSLLRKSKCVNKKGTEFTITFPEKMRKLSISERGYYYAILSNQKLGWGYIHVFVAKTFIGDVPEGYQVNHIDGNKTNNHITNLEIVTPSENIKHAYRTGLRISRGRPPVIKLSKEDILFIRNGNLTNHKLGKMFGVNHKTIANIKRNASNHYPI